MIQDEASAAVMSDDSYEADYKAYSLNSLPPVPSLNILTMQSLCLSLQASYEFFNFIFFWSILFVWVFLLVSFNVYSR